MLRSIFALLMLAFSLPLAAQKQSIVIGSGDLLHIQFYDTPELDQHLRVDDSGNVPLLIAGPVGLAGKTPQEAARVIETFMVAKDIMRHPQVAVAIESSGTQDVSVGGEVNKPGSYMIATPRSILDVLDLAGGLSPVADRHILVQHRGVSMSVTPYYVSNDPQKNLDTDIKVWPGDVVIVPKVGFVYVLGDVARPGGYSLTSNDSRVTLLQALAWSGSLNKTAVSGRVRIVRHSDGVYIDVPIHLQAIQEGRETDPLLRADDVIVVPFSYTKNFLISNSAIAGSLASAAIYVH